MNRSQSISLQVPQPSAWTVPVPPPEPESPQALPPELSCFFLLCEAQHAQARRRRTFFLPDCCWSLLFEALP